MWYCMFVWLLTELKPLLKHCFLIFFLIKIDLFENNKEYIENGNTIYKLYKYYVHMEYRVDMQSNEKVYDT